jgi:homoaconitase/3-isopropylmalate dehydratase large subunit
MGMTITEKILARAAGRKTVSPGEIIEKVNIDMVMLHEGFSRLLYDQFRALGVKFWDLDRVVVMIDHEANPRSQARQEDIVKTKNFAHEFEVTNWYYSEGIAHQVMSETGHVRPGEVIVGTDSHTCTYGAFGAFSSGIGATEAGWIFTTGDMWFRIPESMKFNVIGKLPEMVMAKLASLHSY